MTVPRVLSGDQAWRNADSEKKKNTTVIIEDRLLVRECLLRCMESTGLQGVVLAFPAVTDWINIGSGDTSDLLVLLSGHHANWQRIAADIALIEVASPNCRIVLLLDEENISCIRDALNIGVRGYIPTNLPFEVLLGVLQLVRAGGIFVPASSILSYRIPVEELPIVAPIAGEANLTARQMAVVDGLVRGKPNKVIARELNMREGTVKVCVRTIMKKLNVRNRTEVAYRMTRVSGSVANRFDG
jgi:DNA-binding NarL/FixJ family response regulator